MTLHRSHRGWAHRLLIELLRYPDTTIFVDGTFRCVPKQCVIFMVHDRATGWYAPVIYVLTTAWTYDTFWGVFHFIIQAIDQQPDLAKVLCDFEAALISAVQVHFPNADVIGCLFHFEQAVRRRMQKLTISDHATSS